MLCHAKVVFAMCHCSVGRVSSPVTEFGVIPSTNTTLVIIWQPPATPNGAILSYSISITNLKDGVAQEDNEIAAEQYNFTALDLGTMLIILMCLTLLFVCYCCCCFSSRGPL